MPDNHLIRLMKPNVGSTEMELVKQVIDSGYLVEGDAVREFEKTVCTHVNAKHGIACTSATTGLELALRVLGVGPGDEVIIPDFTHPATALVVMTLSATPVFIDVNIETRNTDAEKIEEAITKKTKAVIPVSIFGHPLDIDPINALKEKYDIHIIDDAACSLGSRYKDQAVGGLTDMTVFSFHPRKVFTTGDGGLITTNNDQWAEQMKSMKVFGSGIKSDGKPGFVQWGTNYRMSNIHGAVALGQVRRLNEIVDDRIQKARVYDDLLKDVKGISIPVIAAYAKSNYQTYTVYIHQEGIRDQIIKEMRSRNIQTQIGTYALHLQPQFENLKRIGDLSNSTKLFENLLALPLHHELSTEDQSRVAQTLNEILIGLTG